MLKGQVNSFELQIQDNQTKFENELETLKVKNESFEAALKLTIKEQEGKIM